MLHIPMVNEITENYQVSISKSTQTGGLLREAWQTQTGISYSPCGPAVRLWDEQTGELTFELWRDKDGNIHRDNDLPAWVKKDPLTKVITEECYLIHGVSHRHLENAPTQIFRDPETGKITYKEWKQHGKYHRESGLPAVVSRDPKTDVITYEAYYIHGEGVKEIERDPLTGKEFGQKNSHPSDVIRKVVAQDFGL